MQIWTATLQ